MANKRQVKKYVKLVCSELLTDCAALSLCESTDPEALLAVVNDTLAVYRDFVSRLSHYEKAKTRQFYAQFMPEFDAAVQALGQRIAQL